MLFLSLTTAVWLITIVHCYPEGAPTGQCNGMTPGHGKEDTGACPYTIQIQSGAEEYEPKQRLKVIIKGDNLKGLILQARVAGSTTKVGVFITPSFVKTIKCDNDDDTVTHINTIKKSDLTVTWTPPDKDVGDIEFVATLAKEKTVWWKNIKSKILKFKQETTTQFATTETITGWDNSTGANPEPEASAQPDLSVSVLHLVLAVGVSLSVMVLSSNLPGLW